LFFEAELSFATTLVTLVVSARLKKFDPTLEEAARNLGANRWGGVTLISVLI